MSIRQKILEDYKRAPKQMTGIVILLLLSAGTIFLGGVYAFLLWIPTAWMIASIGFASRTPIDGEYLRKAGKKTGWNYVIMQTGIKVLTALAGYLLLLWIYLFRMGLYAYWGMGHYLILVFNYGMFLIHASITLSKGEQKYSFAGKDLCMILFLVIYHWCIWNDSGMDDILWGLITIVQIYVMFSKIKKIREVFDH